MITSIRHFVTVEMTWGPLLFAVLMCTKVLGFGVGPTDLLSYIVLTIVAFEMIRHGATFDKALLLFTLYIPLSILAASPDPIFKSWERYLLFLVLLLAVSPLVHNTKAIQFRQKTFKAVLFLCVIIATVSFVCYFLGINLVKDLWNGGYREFQENTAGTFGGITSHSMLLGPISGVAVLASTYLFLQRHKKIYLLLTIACAGSLLFSASRSSLIATLVGEMILLYFFSKHISVMAKRIIPVCLLAVVTFPFWNEVLDGLNAKNKGALSEGVNVESRASKWEMRIEEWQESPVWGIGFVAVSSKDHYAVGGRIEPGSSWLAVLSMTGAVGFILFCIIFFRAVRNILSAHTPERALTGGVLILCGVHMLGEGHIFSGGSFLCFLVWLTIGCATDYVSQNQTKRIGSAG